MAIARRRTGVPVQVPLHEALGWRWDLDELERADHAEDQGDLRQLAEQPDRRRAHPRRSRAHRRDGARAQSVGALGRGLRRRALHGRAREHRVAAGHVRPHDPALHDEQVLRDDRRAPRLHRDQGRSPSARAPSRWSPTRRATSARSSQYGGIGALEGSQDCIEEFRERAQERGAISSTPASRDVAAGVLSGNPPDGAFYAFVKINPDWARDARPRRGRSRVVGDGRTPHQARPHRLRARASTSARAREGYLRLCFGRSRQELAGALASMKAVLAQETVQRS